jgi:histidyl-tRNA synthetase
MEALGIPRGSYVVKVNNRKVLDGVMESIGLGGEENAGRRLTVLRAIDKFDRLGLDGVRQLLGEGRKDESGDFTKGAGLSDDQYWRVRSYLWTSYGEGSEEITRQGELSGETSPIKNYAKENTWPSDEMSFSAWYEAAGDSERGREGVQELESMAALCRAAGYGAGRIMFDSSVVRGLEYYTGPVYEVELLLDTKDEKGRPVRFGSVGGGGRYDGLVSRFRGEVVPATGFSIGVSRLQAALTMLGKLDTKPEFGPVVVTVFDRDRVADYQRMVAALRAEKIRAELYLGNPKNMGNQLKYADRRNSPCVIIQGSDEKARGEVQIKDLIEGAKAAAAIASNQEWRESRPAQFSCREEELVAGVREVLDRHGVKWG